MIIIPLLASVIAAMIIGSLWYGVLFGKLWMRIIGVDEQMMNDPVQKKMMQKQALPLYGVQFLLSLLQVFILSLYVQGYGAPAAMTQTFMLWLACVMPTVAAGVMWTAIPRPLAWKSFFIQAGYHLIMFLVFGFILGL